MLTSKQLTCKQFKILSIILIIGYILIDLIMWTSIGVFLFYTMQLSIFLSVIVYFYCKKQNQKESEDR